MQKIAKFPFTHIGQTKLGKIYRPYAIIEAFSELRDKWQPVEVVIDSGADYTIFPKNFAFILGIDLEKDCFKEDTFGVGGLETVYEYKSLNIRIGTHVLKVPVGFLGRNNIPPLLGRLHCLENLRVTFDNKTTYFELP